MGPNWYLLPSELLDAIAEKVTSLADYIRLRAVCRPWRSACSPRPNHLPLQLPWLMLPYQSDGNDDSTRLFYDLSASKIHKLDIPETRGASICGSSHGWFVLQKSLVVSLLNPITRATIPLHSFTSPVPPFSIGIAPLGASNDELFFVNGEDEKYAIEPTDGIRPHDMHLVDGISGDILLIYPGGPAYTVDGVLQNKSEYTVYKLSNHGETKWNKARDVGQNVLFLGGNYHALSLSSANQQLP